MAEKLNQKAYEIGYDNIADATTFPVVFRQVAVSGITAKRGQALKFADGAYAVAAAGDDIVAISAADISSTDTLVDVYVAGAFKSGKILVGEAAPTEADKVAAQGNGLYFV